VRQRTGRDSACPPVEPVETSTCPLVELVETSTCPLVELVETSTCPPVELVETTDIAAPETLEMLLHRCRKCPHSRTGSVGAGCQNSLYGNGIR